MNTRKTPASKPEDEIREPVAQPDPAPSTHGPADGDDPPHPPFSPFDEPDIPPDPETQRRSPPEASKH